MPLSRLQLAAALIEYDNDNDNDNDDHPSLSLTSPTAARKTHRNSAIFKPYQKRPLDDTAPVHRINPHRAAPAALAATVAQYVESDDRVLSRGSGTVHGRTLSTAGDVRLSPLGPLYDPSAGDRGASSDPSASRYSIAIDPGTVSGQTSVPTQQAPPLDGPDDLDVSQWNLPTHLLSAGTSLPETLFPSSPSLVTRHMPPLHAVSRRSGEITSAPSGRAASVHLDYEDLPNPASGRRGSYELDNEGLEEVLEVSETRGHLDYKEVDEVLAQAERVRRMVEDVEKQRKSVDLTRRSLEVARRLSNPLMIPLPGSPAPPSPRPMGRPMSSLSGGAAFGFGLWDERQDGGKEKDEEVIVDGPNPFASSAPALEHGSVFDPKILEQRRSLVSQGGRASRGSFLRPEVGLGDPSRLPDGKDSAISPPQDAQYRTRSDTRLSVNVSREKKPVDNTKSYPDIPTPEEYGRPLLPTKYLPRPIHPETIRRSFLRPKTLVMPSSLADQPPSSAKRQNIPEGYTLGEKPLPAGARSSILILPSSASFPAGFGRAGLPLSLSQRTFRSSLMVGGEREDGFVGGTEEEGGVGVGRVEGEELWEVREDGGRERRPGKLFGTSLIDQLEARKAAQRGKQRVFTGDSRPAMMARSSRSSQYLSLPSSSPSASSPTRPASMQPPLLLQVDPNGEESTTDIIQLPDRLSKSRSVFGIDQIWEKEMAKLQIIQAREAREQEIQEELAERARREKEEQAERSKREKEEKKRKKKGKGRAVDSPILGETGSGLDVYELRPLGMGDRRSESGMSSAGQVRDLPPGPENPLGRMGISDEPFIQDTAGEAADPEPPTRTRTRQSKGEWAGGSDKEDGSRPKKDKTEMDTGYEDQGEALGAAAEESGTIGALPLADVTPSSVNTSLPVPSVEVEETDDEDEIPLSKLLPKSLGVNGLALSNNTRSRPASWFGGPSPPSLLSTSTFGRSIDTAKPVIPLSQAVGPSYTLSGEEDDDIPLLLTKFASLSPYPQSTERAEKAKREEDEEEEDDLPLGYKHANLAHRQSLAADHARLAGSLWAQEYEEQARRMVSAPQGMGYGQPFPGMNGFGGQEGWYPPPMSMGYGPGPAYGYDPLAYQAGFQGGYQGGYSGYPGEHPGGYTGGYQGGYPGGFLGGQTGGYTGYPWPQRPSTDMPIYQPGMEWTTPSAMPIPMSVPAEASVEVAGVKQTEQIDSWRKGVRCVSTISTAAASATGRST